MDRQDVQLETKIIDSIFQRSSEEDVDRTYHKGLNFHLHISQKQILFDILALIIMI